MTLNYLLRNKFGQTQSQVLYEEGKNLQWNATTDIPWNEIPEFNPVLEKAIC